MLEGWLTDSEIQSVYRPDRSESQKTKSVCYTRRLDQKARKETVTSSGVP